MINYDHQLSMISPALVAQAVCRICQMGMVCRHAEDLLPMLRIMAGPLDPQEVLGNFRGAMEAMVVALKFGHPEEHQETI